MRRRARQLGRAAGRLAFDLLCIVALACLAIAYLLWKRKS